MSPLHQERGYLGEPSEKGLSNHFEMLERNMGMDWQPAKTRGFPFDSDEEADFRDRFMSTSPFDSDFFPPTFQ